jgi:hypothetical protein
MSEEVVTALIGILPQLLLVLLVAVAGIALRRPLRDHVLPRVSGVKVVGFELSLSPDRVRGSLEAAASQGSRPRPDPSVATDLVQRATRNADVVRDRRVLWVDDNPEYNRSERYLLHTLGIFVDVVRSHADAQTALEQPWAGPWDLVISDIGRDDGRESGLDLLPIAGRPPLIYYVGRLSGPPPEGAFGITNRPDEFLHLVLDVLERTPAVGSTPAES